MTLTEDQLALRRSAVTATDVPAIAGADPYKTGLDVWLEKTGRTPPEDVSAARHGRRKWGHLLEPLLRADFAERHGVVVAGPCATIVRTFIDGTRIAATPDGSIPAWGCGWEAKTHSVALRSLYGEEGSDVVPLRELLQCQTGMLVTGIRAWRLTVFMDGAPKDYSISADDELHQMIIEMSAKWWRDHVVADKPPPLDGSDACHDTLSRLYPESGQLIRSATDDERALALELKRTLRELGDGAEKVERLKAQIKDAIGDDAGIQWGLNPDEKITWRKSKDGRKTDWQACAYEFATRVQLAGSDPLIPRMLHVLGSLGSGFVIEGGGSAFSTGDALATIDHLVEEIRRGLDIAAHSAVKPGSRRFLMPKGWSE